MTTIIVVGSAMISGIATVLIAGAIVELWRISSNWLVDQPS